METGRTVVLLNLDHLYESLYDALNQVSRCRFYIFNKFNLVLCLLWKHEVCRLRPSKSSCEVSCS